jgi:hypothetical protein
VLGACRAGSSLTLEGLGSCMASTSPVPASVCGRLSTARLGPLDALGIGLGKMPCISLIDKDDRRSKLISSGCPRSFFVRIHQRSYSLVDGVTIVNHS